MSIGFGLGLGLGYVKNDSYQALALITTLWYNDLMSKFQIHTISTKRYGHTVLWAVFLSILIVCIMAGLGRAAHNFQAALTDKPDVAIYLLLEDEHLGHTTLIHTNKEDTERTYLADTPTGTLLVRLRKNKEWHVDLTEPLHPAASTSRQTPTTGTPPQH